MSRIRAIAPGEYYHVYNRGALKANIFRSDADRRRFLFTLLYYQSPEDISHVTKTAHAYESISGFPVKEQTMRTIIEKRTLGLVCFCLMPNHFHLLLYEKEEGGISAYMQRVLVAHTHYMNTKYGLSGHVFQGNFKSVHVKDNHQLLYLSAYIHRNPRELKAWKGKEFDYPWSSLQDFTEANRWGGLLMSDIIAEQFETTPNSNYRDFVGTSSAKIFEKEIPELIKPA